MRLLLFQVGLLVSLFGFVHQAHATAYYLGSVSGTLEFIQIGTGSVFDNPPPMDGANLDDLIITVDPAFQSPVLQVEQQPTVALGAGDYTVRAGASTELHALDPFNIQVGDEVRIRASVEGSAKLSDGDGSWSEASAGVATSLFVINDTNHDVYVDTVWHSCESLYWEGFGSEGEEAFATISSVPIHGESCWSDPTVYMFAANTTDTIELSASASGSARAVPEPSSLLVWLTIVSVGGIATVTQQRQSSQKKS